jgi:hypothetical protein
MDAGCNRPPSPPERRSLTTDAALLEPPLSGATSSFHTPARPIPASLPFRDAVNPSGGPESSARQAPVAGDVARGAPRRAGGRTASGRRSPKRIIWLPAATARPYTRKLTRLSLATYVATAVRVDVIGHLAAHRDCRIGFRTAIALRESLGGRLVSYLADDLRHQRQAHRSCGSR